MATSLECEEYVKKTGQKCINKHKLIRFDGKKVCGIHKTQKSKSKSKRKVNNEPKICDTLDCSEKRSIFELEKPTHCSEHKIEGIKNKGTGTGGSRTNLHGKEFEKKN